MQQIDWLEIGQQVAILITAAAGGGGVYWLVQQLKQALGWHGDRARALAVAVSVVVGIAGLIAAGELGLADVTESNLSNVVLLIYVAAYKFYERLQARG